VQAELRRVGCLTGSTDGNWSAASQRSLTQFNRYAGTKLDTRLASTDALDTIKLKSARVCPLVCEHGYKADGERCTRITCAAGSFLNDDNECEKRREKKPVAKRDRPETRNAPAAARVPGERVVIRAPRVQGGYPAGNPNAPGMSAQGRPLTGQERATGCHSYGAIMSGVCP
jgi:hypothetical protein